MSVLPQLPSPKFDVLVMDGELRVGGADALPDAVVIMAAIYNRTGIYLGVLDEQGDVRAWIAKEGDWFKEAT